MLVTALISAALTAGAVGSIFITSNKDRKNSNIIQKPEQKPTIIKIDNSFNKTNTNCYNPDKDDDKLKEDIITDIRNIFKEQESDKEFENFLKSIDQELAKYNK